MKAGQTAAVVTDDTTTCPVWCSGEHQYDRDSHPDDHYVVHLGTAIDRWTPDDDTSEEIDVRVYGTRFERKEAKRWPDAVCIYGEVGPSLVGGLELQADDAARLAKALLRGTEILRDAEQ